MPLNEVDVPGSDDWWLVRLAEKLGNNFPRLALLDSYRDGSFVVPITSDPAVRDAYKKFAERARLTFGETIVSQTSGRLHPRGFRTAAEDDKNGDVNASRLWRGSHLGVQVRDMFDDRGTYGEAFGVVGLDEFGEVYAKFTNPWTTAVEMNALRPWVVDAALIVAWDPILLRDTMVLLRPGVPSATMRVAFREGEQSSINTDGTVWTPGTEWEWAGAAQALGFTERVPVVPFRNPRGVGEFENHLDSISRVTEDILQRLTITAMQAFRQRAVIPGDAPLPEFYPEGHPQAGQAIDYNELYKGGPAALWFMPPGAEMWESAATDLQGLLSSEKQDLEHLAAVTATPLYSLSPDANQSAEGAKLARETIRTKVRDRQARDSVSLAEMMSLMFEAAGDVTRSERTQIETIWGPMELVTKADVAESARAAKQAGQSQRFIGEHIYELTPEELELEAESLRDEQLQMSLLGLGADDYGGFVEDGDAPRETQAGVDSEDSESGVGAVATV